MSAMQGTMSSGICGLGSAMALLGHGPHPGGKRPGRKKTSATSKQPVVLMQALVFRWIIPIFNRKYIDSIRVHFPASYVSDPGVYDFSGSFNMCQKATKTSGRFKVGNKT